MFRTAIRWCLARLFSRLVQIFVVLVLAIGLPFFMLPAIKRAKDDPGYALAFFADIVPVDQVLASRRWHRFAAEPWDCTFAVVSLTDDAATAPVSRLGRDVHWMFRWGGAWQETPVSPLGDTRDAVGFCASNFDTDLNKKIAVSLGQPGSYYWRDRVGENIHLYAKPQRLALKIRYGD